MKNNLSYYLVITILSTFFSVSFSLGFLFLTMFIFKYNNEFYFFISLPFFMLGPPFAVFLTNRSNLSPSFLDINSQQSSLDEEINNLSSDIRDHLSNPGELTLNQMKELIGKSSTMFSKMEALRHIQEKRISDLNEAFNIEKKKSDEAKALSEEAKRMTKEQLDLIKLVITKDAKIESRKSFIYGIVVSFPIGVLSSFAVVFITKKFFG